MLQHLIKRFILALPALWLLVTLVFLLSRLLVGAPGAEQILQGDGGYYSKGSTASRELAYKSYLKRTGQDVPLFYFSVQPAPEPDSLYLIYPESHRAFLKKLYWQYGNSQAVSDYFNSIKTLEQATTPDQERNLYIERLYSATEPNEIREAIISLPQLNFDNTANTHTLKLKSAAGTLLNHERAYAFLLPSFRWHGSANQYHTWLMSALQGDLGKSYRDGRPVNEIISEAVANTWWLILASILIAFIVSLELGMLLIMPGSITLRKFILPILFILDSIPLFLLALILLVLLATPTFIQLFPVYGLGYDMQMGTSWFERIRITTQYMALPAICLILSNIPYLTNLIYRSFSEENRKDYARTAKAKGFSARQIIRKQLMKNTLLPTITVLSDALPALVAGAIVVETIFAIPGIGRLTVDAVLGRDYPVIIAIVMLVAVFRVILYLLADICYSLADPRIKYASS